MPRTGRPPAAVSEANQRELVRRVAAGASFAEAVEQACVKPATFVKLLDRPDFAAFAAAILAERVAA